MQSRKRGIFYYFFSVFLFLIRCEGKECVDFGAGVCKTDDVFTNYDKFDVISDDIFEIKDTLSEYFGTYPENATKNQILALKYVNEYRNLVKVPLVNEIEEINCACQNHANYYITNYQKYKETGYSPHFENPQWKEGFTGESFWDRMKYCGYKGMGGWEIIAFVNSPKAAVDEWMDTLYHRIPIIHPSAIEIGYGNAAKGGYAKIDVMDFGRGTSNPQGNDIIYPVAGQEDIATAFNGWEWPQPPPPPEGYPSGPIITIIFGGALAFKITEHYLVENDQTSIQHMFLAPYEDKEKGIKKDSMLSKEIAMYSYKPLNILTKYTVIIKGTMGGKPFEKNWSFKTGKK